TNKDLIDTQASVPPSAIKIFISHSSRDKEIAEALITLIRHAMPIAPEEIRCTSVNGYRLRVGARAGTELRREILACPAFVGLITDTSMDSAYVLLELGARWGANKYLAP